MTNIKMHITHVFVFIIPLELFGQLSPGKLSSAHQELDGLSNCLQCHDLGNKVPDNKCLTCHDEIEALINSNRGYHASQEVIDRNCTECHSEHHGPKFDMTRFDEDIFDHDLTGYTLEGKHAIIECRSCHTPDYVVDIDLQQREDTYLGLEYECLSCHDDFHQGTLDNNCIECHDFETFRPASKFDHADTDFRLVGAHKDVSCIECHKAETKNGKDFQVFSNIRFSDCISCHDDPHQSNIPGKCNQCHVESSFQIFKKKNRFNHSKTGFQLKGSHKSISCFDCHNENLNVKQIFQDKVGIVESQCISCHEDIHIGKFGKDCSSCHSEESFLTLINMNSFDHNVTDYPLEGLHQNVDCKECHKTRYTDAIEFSKCKNCHTDYHNGEFIANGESPDCKKCHIIDNGFTFTTYDLEDHQMSSFVLTGSHIATPCFECHLDEDHWTFRNVGRDCLDCHTDIHDGYISKEYYGDDNCTACHNTESWSTIDFEHSDTKWPLQGEHINVSCADCHFERIDNGNEFSQVFIDLDQSCVHCHDNPHGSQFEIEGVTDCKSCHNSNDWLPNNFDHSLTNFPLDGRHAELECQACHTNELDNNGTVIVDFKIDRFECIDCHL